MKHLLWVFVLVVFCACQASSPIEASKQNKVLSSCDAIRAEADNVLTAFPPTCKIDADCVCFMAGISYKFPCGGITNLKIYNNLQHLLKEYQESKCGYTVACGPWRCQPKCVNNLCVNSPR